MNEPQLNEDGTKTCPQCAEHVQGAALVCRFCGYRFDGTPAPVAPGETSTSGVAVAAFLCSLLDLWIAAIPLGIHARRQIDQSGGRKTGRGFATAGIVIGVIGMVASVILVIAIIEASKPASHEAAATTPSAPIASEGTKPLWKPSDPNKAPSETELSNAGIEPGYGYGGEADGGAKALMTLLNTHPSKAGEEVSLEYRNCVLEAIYGKEGEPDDKYSWLAIALHDHEAAAEEAVEHTECGASG